MSSKSELTQQNRAVFAEVVQALFIDRDVDRFGQYVSDEQYIQHNPMIPDGKEAVLAFLHQISKLSDKPAEIIHVLLDGDIGVVHARAQLQTGTMSLVDMFRIEKGKLVEHWDVLNPPPPVRA